MLKNVAICSTFCFFCGKFDDMPNSLRYDIIVAIDPDREKSGVAVLHTQSKEVSVVGLSFPNLVDFISNLSEDAKSRNKSLKVFVEGGWLVKKSNYHAYQGHRAEKIAKDVGANHETGRKIVEMLDHKGVEVEVVHPLKKCWKGMDGKITHEELSQFVNIKSRTNQDERDAVLLAWVIAGFPIKLIRF